MTVCECVCFSDRSRSLSSRSKGRGSRSLLDLEKVQDTDTCTPRTTVWTLSSLTNNEKEKTSRESSTSLSAAHSVSVIIMNSYKTQQRRGVCYRDSPTTSCWGVFLSSQGWGTTGKQSLRFCLFVSWGTNSSLSMMFLFPLSSFISWDGVTSELERLFHRGHSGGVVAFYLLATTQQGTWRVCSAPLLYFTFWVRIILLLTPEEWNFLALKIISNLQNH